MANKDLDYYLAQARRIAEHREAGAEKEIRKLYKSMLKDLKSFVAEAYEKYADDDDFLSYAVLQKAGYDARFLEEVEKRIGIATPKAAKELRELVNETYKIAYDGMVEAVLNQHIVGLDEAFADSIAITPQQIKNAVKNPFMELALEKNHKDAIYDIKHVIATGLMNGDRYSTMAKRLTETVDKDYNNAIRIARTEAHRVREAGNVDAAVAVDMELQNGTTGMRLCKTWYTKDDAFVRPQYARKRKKGGWVRGVNKKAANHVVMHDVTVLANENFDLKDGNKAMAPGQSGVAGHDINCRCEALYDMMTDKEYFKKTGKHFPGGDETPASTLKDGSKIQEITDAYDFEYGDYTQEDYIKWVDDYERHNSGVRLSDKELEVIDNYTEGDFISINGVSRDMDEALLKQGFTKEDIALARKNADILDGALSKYDLDTNIVTHRFERDVSWLTGRGNDISDLEALIGKEYTAKGFTSSGMTANRSRFTGGKSDAVHFEIVTPKGTNGAFLSMSRKGEEEFLYNRNTRFVVLDGGERIVKEWKWNIKTMQMEQVDVKERFLKVQAIPSKGIIRVDNVLEKPTQSMDVSYALLLDRLENISKDCKYNPVIGHAKTIAENEIIKMLSGSDKTEGSCASAGLAYIGQRQGWNVLDFRGGRSRTFFANSSVLHTFSEADGLKVHRAEGACSLTVGNRLLKKCEPGKEYFLCVGQHVSIVRKTDEGVLQYLELQSTHFSGWTDFNANPKYTLKSRFGCSQRSSSSEHFDFMIDLDESNFATDDFRSLLGYLNTAENEQRKGAGGSIK